MNFMAPVPVATWHKDMVDELFVGLFGGLSASSVEDQSKPKKKRSDKGAEDASSMGGSVWNGLGEITVLR